MRIPAEICEDHFRVLEPQINAEGIHVWPFDPSFSVDVRFMTSGPRQNVRSNRHDHFEVIYLCAGAADLHVQDRLLPFHRGEVAVIGSTAYHRLEGRTWPFTVAVLFFQPDLILSDGGLDCAEYLTPFLSQDSQFPFIVPAKSGIPSQVFHLMQRIRTELPARSLRARLSVKTYLKMILILLVNQYSSYVGTIETFQRQRCALERLRPLFQHLEERYGEPIQVRDAARMSGLSKSHFMNLFKRTTGQSFMAYLTRCRIERAQALLVTTDIAMSRISQETGFCDQSYFGNVFRRLMGMAPAAYRRKFGAHARNGDMGAASSRVVTLAAAANGVKRSHTLS